MLRNAFTALLLGLFVWVCFPLITPVAMGGVFALLFWPWFVKLEQRRIPSALAAALITTAFSVLVLLPISLLIVTALMAGLAEFRVLQQQWTGLPVLGGAGVDDGSWMSRLSRHHAVVSIIEKLSRWFPVSSEELIATTADVLKVVGAKMGQGLADLASRIPGMIVALVMAIVSLYFFLIDGRNLTAFVRRNSFFSPAQTGEFFSALGVMARSVVLASVASGLAQSLVFCLGMLIAGAANLGMVVFLVFLSSFLPLVGSAPVTFGVTLIAVFSGKSDQAVILGISALLASLIDNVVRPMVLKGGANLHPMVGFIAAFGGLQVFGISGLFLGPIVAGMFMTVLRLNLRAG